jgi:hypothetical protein
MKYIIYSLLFLAISCKSADKGNDDMKKLYDEVMAIHDEVMPKMDDIHDTKKDLAKMLATADSTQVFDIMKKLDNADEAMMVWMQDFDPNYDQKSKEDQKEYLNNELEKVKKVKMIMLESIEDGKHLLQSKTTSDAKNK